jgi:hypothetical protein
MIKTISQIESSILCNMNAFGQADAAKMQKKTNIKGQDPETTLQGM